MATGAGADEAVGRTVAFLGPLSSYSHQVSGGACWRWADTALALADANDQATRSRFSGAEWELLPVVTIQGEGRRPSVPAGPSAYRPR